MFRCDTCSATFNKLYNLYKHQRTAKYCLGLKNSHTVEHLCEYCNKSYGRKDALYKHQRICQLRQNKIDSPSDIEKLTHSFAKIVAESQVELVKQFQDTNNRPNIVLPNTPVLTEENVRESLANLTINIIQDGGKGYAKYADLYMFKNRVLCTDKARKKLQYKNTEGELIKDYGGVKLTQNFFQAISKRNEEIIKAEYKDLQEQVHDIAQAGRAHQSDITDLLGKSVHLQDLLIKCKDAASGKENDLTREFVNQLSKLL